MSGYIKPDNFPKLDVKMDDDEFTNISKYNKNYDISNKKYNDKYFFDIGLHNNNIFYSISLLSFKDLIENYVKNTVKENNDEISTERAEEEFYKEIFTKTVDIDNDFVNKYSFHNLLDEEYLVPCKILEYKNPVFFLSK